MTYKAKYVSIYTSIDRNEMKALVDYAWRQRITRHKLSRMIHQYVLAQLQDKTGDAEISFQAYLDHHLWLEWEKNDVTY